MRCMRIAHYVCALSEPLDKGLSGLTRGCPQHTYTRLDLHYPHHFPSIGVAYFTLNLSWKLVRERKFHSKDLRRTNFLRYHSILVFTRRLTGFSAFYFLRAQFCMYNIHFACISYGFDIVVMLIIRCICGDVKPFQITLHINTLFHDNTVSLERILTLKNKKYADNISKACSHFKILINCVGGRAMFLRTTISVPK